MTQQIETLERNTLYQFFQQEVSRSANHMASQVPPATQIYLANLLTRFARSEMLFAKMEGKNEMEPLAFILKRALEQSENERIQTLKYLGDLALFTSGLFSDRIERRGVEVSYYIEMGGMAYSNVADLASHRARATTYRDLYEKLAQHFRDLVNLLWTFSDQSNMDQSSDLLSQYHQWERTGSKRLERKLIQAGFILTPSTNRCSS